MNGASTDPNGAPAALVLGANGGCGASLLAGALALAVARSQSGVWLMELDLGRGDRAEAWSLPAERTLADLLVLGDELQARHLAQAAQTGPGGLNVLNAPSGPAGADGWSSEVVTGLVRAGRSVAAPGGCVVLDGGTGAAMPARAAAELVGTVLIVCSSTVAAVRRARRTMDALAPRSGSMSPACAVVVAHGPGTRELGARAIARALSAPVRGELPWSPGEATLLACGRWPTGRRVRLAGAITAIARTIT